MISLSGALRFTMQDTDFFSWRRTMLLRFQRMEAAEEVYHEIELQAQQLEYDYYSLCVSPPGTIHAT